MPSTSCILAVEASILLKGVGYSDKEALEVVANNDITIPLGVFKEEYTKAFYKANYVGRWMAKEQYLNLTKDEIRACLEAVSKKGKA